MKLWKKMLPECYTEHHLLNAVFLIQDSDCIALCVNRHCAVQLRVSLRAVLVQLLNSSGLDDEIFLVAESGVKSALFSSLTLFSKE